MKTHLKIGKATADAEKVLIPTIIFMNLEHPQLKEDGVKGFSISFGWWDYYVFIAFASTTRPTT